MARSAAIPARPFPVHARGATLLAILAMGVWSVFALDLTWDDVVPGMQDFH